MEYNPEYLGPPSESYLGHGRFGGHRLCSEISEAIGPGDTYISTKQLRSRLAMLPCVTIACHPPVEPCKDSELEKLQCEVDRLKDEAGRLIVEINRLRYGCKD